MREIAPARDPVHWPDSHCRTVRHTRTDAAGSSLQCHEEAGRGEVGRPWRTVLAQQGPGSGMESRQDGSPPNEAPLAAARRMPFFRRNGANCLKGGCWPCLRPSIRAAKTFMPERRGADCNSRRRAMFSNQACFGIVADMPHAFTKN